MLEIRQNEQNQIEHYVYGNKTGKTFYTGTAEGCLNFIKARREDIKRAKRNMARRQQNQVLRDLCGTSAAAARRDMGL